MKWYLWVIVLFPIALVFMAVSYPDRMASKLDIGMSVKQVEEILGEEPRLNFDTNDLCERFDWRGNCNEARKSKSVEFSLWKMGIDTYLVVGFNQKRKVSFVGVGDS